MYLWRKSGTPRWLRANEVALRTKASSRLAVIERSNQKHLQLEVCCKSAKESRRFVNEFGGQVEKLSRDWLKRFSREQKTKPIKIGKRLVITRSGGFQTAGAIWKSPILVIPAGAAFGTGDHATTAMSLRLLEKVSRKLKPGWSVVDLGTGSGILALAAKRFGAKHVLAIDNDPRAISTARKNARTNKIDNIDFKVGDVRRWKFSRKIDIVIANLFGELLIEILPNLKIADQLILSGVLRNQERDLRRALRLCQIDIVQVRRRGKWIALIAQKRI